MYYLRSRPAADAIKFTLDVEALLNTAGDIKIDKNINMFNQTPFSEGNKRENILELEEDKENMNKENARRDANEKLEGEDAVKKPKKKWENIKCTDEVCLSCGS